MKEENLIYIRLEYEEALKSKRALLSTEANLLRIAGVTRRYRLLRTKEMQLKLALLRKIHSLKAEITKMQQVLPKIKIPSILQKQPSLYEEKDSFEVTEPISRRSSISSNNDLEVQLREIQEKLKELQ